MELLKKYISYNISYEKYWHTKKKTYETSNDPIWYLCRRRDNYITGEESLY